MRILPFKEKSHLRISIIKGRNGIGQGNLHKEINKHIHSKRVISSSSNNSVMLQTMIKGSKIRRCNGIRMISTTNEDHLSRAILTAKEAVVQICSTIASLAIVKAKAASEVVTKDINETINNSILTKVLMRGK